MGHSSSSMDKNKSTKKNTSLNASQMDVEQQIAVLAQIKDRRAADMLAFEAQRTNLLAYEVQVKANMDAQKHKMLDDVKRSQQIVDQQISQVHQEHDILRRKLCEDLVEAENKLQNNISYILESAHRNRDPDQLKKMLEQERRCVDQLLALKLEEYRELRKMDMLDAMQNQLENDLWNQAQNKIIRTNDLTLMDSAKEAKIREILQNQKKDQAALVSDLLKEELWQQHAFASLLAQRDVRSQQLKYEIQAVTSQLNQLTDLELRRRSREMEANTNILSDTRLQLAALLAQLLAQQEERQHELQNLLADLEVQRQTQAEDYWLIQYQRLMENIPSAFIPIPVCGTTETPPARLQPSAPNFFEEPSASAPEPKLPSAKGVFVENSCVICLDNTCQIIFLRCGHMCCCGQCADTVRQCPMCRTSIEQRLHLNL